MSFRKLSFFFWDGYESSSFLFCNGFLNGSWAFVLFGLGVLWVHGRRHWKPEMVNCDTARKCLRLDSLEIPEMFSSLAWKQKSPRSGAYRLVMRVLSVCPFPILSLKDTFNWCVWVYMCTVYVCLILSGTPEESIRVLGTGVMSCDWGMGFGNWLGAHYKRS